MNLLVSKNLENQIEGSFDQCIRTLTDAKKLTKKIIKALSIIQLVFENNGKVIAFGNGGSAADAQHFVAEFVGRFKKERRSLPAIAFTTDSSIITSIANDYNFNKIFERQCESLVDKNDVVVAISTSGNSENVLKGVKMAKKRGAKIVGLSGKDGGKLVKMVDVAILAPSNSTPRIQEVHRLILHIICDIIDEKISKI